MILMILNELLVAFRLFLNFYLIFSAILICLNWSLLVIFHLDATAHYYLSYTLISQIKINKVDILTI